MQKKRFDKIQYPFMIKTLQKVGIEGTFLNVIYDKSIAIILNGENMKVFFPRSRTRQGCHFLPFLFKYSFGSPSHNNQRRK